ncbi:putative DNA-binding protein YlxM (UPF0122 family) [Peptoniphilus olsenii]|uniref:UPF0122 protein ABID14_000025 n=1 Tax=Peptoniphilus olsenii TaxID=411570 RepID=A0ABV2J6K9_9FIRM
MAEDKFFIMNSLLDFYGSLLTEKQKKAAYMYYVYDCSINEISDELNISKQAVFDNLKRAENNLQDYESKLHLLEQTRLQESVNSDRNKKLKSLFSELKKNKNIDIKTVNKIEELIFE